MQRFIYSGLLTVIFFLISSPTTNAAAMTAQWSSPRALSAAIDEAWFPDMSADGQGQMHVIFSGTDLRTLDKSKQQKYDKVYYVPISADGDVPQTDPTDVAVSPYGVVARNSIAADTRRALLHIIFRAKGSLYYQNVAIKDATNAAKWSEPRNIDDNGTSYYSSIAVDSRGTIHVAWTQVAGQSLDTFHQVVLYRYSSDLGLTWSFPKEISAAKYGTTRPVLKIDQADHLHVSWDDGYDNQTGRFTAALGGYTHSDDGGQTWAKPVVFGSESQPIGQVAMTTYGANGVMLVWRVLEQQRIEYVQSHDGGRTWTQPAPVPAIVARPFGAQHQFDRYDLVTDGYNHVHLVAVGLTDSSKIGLSAQRVNLSVYHSLWHDGQWAAPDVVAPVAGYAEYPKLAITPGRISLVWFTRDSAVNEGINKVVWYSSQSFDTGLTAQPLIPVTVTRPRPATPNTLTTPLPIAPEDSILPPNEEVNPQQSWLREGYSIIGLSLLPVALIGAITILVILSGTRRKRVRR